MGDIDSHANADVRSVLDRVSEWASRNKVAILAISHLNKNTMMSAKHRVMGSMAFVAVSRIVWNVVEDPEDSKRRLFLLSKTNIVEDIGGLAFRLKSVKVGEEEEIETAVCDFESKTLEESANELLESTVENLEHTKNKAIKWLKNTLKDGPLMVKDIMTVAKEEGISETVLSRAKKVLQIRTKKVGVDGGWEWEL
jgi:putative DNA primase/helicase